MLGFLTTMGLASWLFLVALILMTSYFLMHRSHGNLPPSPGIALPVIGHLYLMKKNPREQFLNWSRELGEIFTLQMGAQTVVVLSSYDILKETLVKQADIFSDRPTTSLMTTAVHDGALGILFSTGPLWKEQRSTTLSILREFGMGKNVLAQKIAEEVSFFMDELAKTKGQPQDLHRLTTTSVSNNICSIIFGQRFDFNDQRFHKLLDTFEKIVKIISGVAVVNFFPFLQRLPIDVGGAKKITEYNTIIRNFCREFIKEHKEKKATDSEGQTSFVRAYLDEMDKKHEKGQETFLDENNLSRVMQNLFAAGTETTSTAIMWFLLYCLHFPQVQQKIYEEIEKEIGLERPPNIADRSKLKYLHVVILETLRLASIVPFSLQHEVPQDVDVKGYTIPKGTQIVPHLDSVLLDEKIWGDPGNFRPERFLDEEGNILKKDEFIPFSLGRRVCLGEALAKMELFLYTSTLIQRFEFLPADPNNLPPRKGKFGITCGPQNFLIRCAERKT